MPNLLLTTGETAVFDLDSILTNAVTSVQGDLLGALAIVVPAIVVVVGACIAVRFGLKWVRTMAKG